MIVDSRIVTNIALIDGLQKHYDVSICSTTFNIEEAKKYYGNTFEYIGTGTIHSLAGRPHISILKHHFFVRSNQTNSTINVKVTETETKADEINFPCYMIRPDKKVVIFATDFSIDVGLSGYIVLSTDKDYFLGGHYAHLSNDFVRFNGTITITQN